MEQLAIELNAPSYKAGDLMEGRLLLDLAAPTFVQDITLFIEGTEYSFWSKGSGKNRRTFSETKTIFRNSINLFENKDLQIGDVLSAKINAMFGQEREKTFDAGAYDAPFSFRLPNLLPATIQTSSRSYIKYQITAVVNVPLGRDMKVVTPFYVYETQYVRRLKGVKQENEKHFWFNENTIEAKIELDQDVYFPNSVVKGTMLLTNHSSKEVEAIVVELAQICSLKAKSLKHDETTPTLLVRQSDLGIRQGRETEVSFDFRLPDGLQPSTETGELVKVKYGMVFRLEIAWAMDMEIGLPVTILGNHVEVSDDAIKKALFSQRT